MDLDLTFVSSVLERGKGGLRAATERGVSPEMLFGEGRIAYEFVLGYAKQYGDVPAHDSVAGATGVAVPGDPTGPVEFFADNIIERSVSGRLRRKLEDWAGPLGEGKGTTTLEAMEAEIRTIRTERKSARTERMTALADAVMEEYEAIKHGHIGIPYPWPSMNEVTMGMWPEDLIVFVARVGIGKTWTGVMIARHAWMQGRRVLFLTTEIAQKSIARRFVALHLGLPYRALRKGLLSTFDEKRVYEEIKTLRDADGLYIVGGSFDGSFDALDAAIDDCKPEIVVIDGAYLMRGGKALGTSASRTEKAAWVFDELKRGAKRNKVPFVATSQFNREVKGNKADTVEIEKIALTDAASWNADGVFALVQTQDMRRDRKLDIVPLKNREGELSEAIHCTWDFDQMKFDELPQAGGGEADEAGLDPVPPDVKEKEHGKGPDPFTAPPTQADF